MLGQLMIDRGLKSNSKGATMNLDELSGELMALLDFKQWLEEKLRAVEIDIADNEQTQADIIADMEDVYYANRL